MFGYFHQPKMIQFDFGHNCLKVWRNESPSFCEDTLQNFVCLFVVFVVPSFLWGRWWSQQKIGGSQNRHIATINPSRNHWKFLSRTMASSNSLGEMIPTSLPNVFIRPTFKIEHPNPGQKGRWISRQKSSTKKKQDEPRKIPLYWFVNRDPYNRLL